MVSDAFVTAWLIAGIVSIRFEVRGGFRHLPQQPQGGTWVSIRFEVRGGFRLEAYLVLWPSAGFNPL